jgi:quercetin dioxygenase-like cupin family protein
MIVTRAPGQPTKRGPAEYFTGVVWLDDLGAATGAGGVRIVRVTFEPGARTAWHTHPHGQTLHILSGLGRIQRAGGEPVEVRPGDTVWFEPGEKHWHGAAPGHGMVHLAVQQADASGSAATWMEHVTDVDYLRPAAV